MKRERVEKKSKGQKEKKVADGERRNEEPEGEKLSEEELKSLRGELFKSLVERLIEKKYLGE